MGVDVKVYVADIHQSSCLEVQGTKAGKALLVSPPLFRPHTVLWADSDMSPPSVFPIVPVGDVKVTTFVDG